VDLPPHSFTLKILNQVSIFYIRNIAPSSILIFSSLTILSEELARMMPSAWHYGNLGQFDTPITSFPTFFESPL
jgi:hypothetical protein